MIAFAAFALLALADPPEQLPIDAAMATFEVAVPELRQIEARAEEQVWQLGPPEPGWAMAGLAPASAIIARDGNVEDHVLGEWEEGGHGVNIPGDRPLVLPPGLHRYAVRRYEGPVSYHYYHRPVPGIVIHTFGAARRIGNADCTSSQGVELIAHEPWRDWSTTIALQAFGLARAARDDGRTYCMMYRAAAGGRFEQLAYTPDGRPYLIVNQDPQAFALTPRAEAAERLFSVTSPRSTTDD